LGELRKRVIAGCFLAPVIGAVFYFLPPRWFIIFVALVILIALHEITTMVQIRERYILVFLPLVGLVPLYSKQLPLFILWLLISPFLYLLWKFFQSKEKQENVNEDIIKGTIIMVFGGVFIVIPLFSFYILKELNNYYPLILLMAVWASDICAFIAGKNFGKRPFAPLISPKKTYEGFIGAVLGSTIIIVASHTLFGFSIIKSLVIGIAIGVLGQAGDLLESAAKRVSGKKDSSSLIPGHGGILDRIDSFIFTAPFLMFICTTWKAW
jgi:phosphatidate cytidylyltransferase